MIVSFLCYSPSKPLIIVYWRKYNVPNPVKPTDYDSHPLLAHAHSSNVNNADLHFYNNNNVNNNLLSNNDDLINTNDDDFDEPPKHVQKLNKTLGVIPPEVGVFGQNVVGLLWGVVGAVVIDYPVHQGDYATHFHFLKHFGTWQGK